MKTKAIKYFFFLFVSLFLGVTACTKQGIKNRAVALAIEQFDDEAQTTAKTHFVDLEQQKVFIDFTKMSTKIEVESVEIKSDTEATAQLVIKTFPKSLAVELATISGKEWKNKADAAMETKTYTLKLQKVDNIWKLVEKTENPK